ncbi:rhodanese-like domain-containing protein [Paenibacillus sp. J5C_2022]|uniref:rhodanese-like domain-containing protein n=1 Tax=Paenibacillus sp. J5C2022 TaxID=2977129 RepID=UPI0021D1DD0B|nr:rhodanese-like domain-containing protein [Paenibacillus sp. J5C2022]MCU6711531.1 rhodanese-like domain-containing protein [Paenibacillus sp. J5C2022]
MKEITAKQVVSLIEEGKMLNMIDVRETDEIAEGKIPGAKHIPLGLIEFRMHELDKAKEYIMVCRSGGRSGRATEFLESHGFNVINMEGGMLAWEGEVVIG